MKNKKKIEVFLRRETFFLHTSVVSVPSIKMAERESFNLSTFVHDGHYAYDPPLVRSRSTRGRGRVSSVPEHRTALETRLPRSRCLSRAPRRPPARHRARSRAVRPRRISGGPPPLRAPARAASAARIDPGRAVRSARAPPRRAGPGMWRACPRGRASSSTSSRSW